jgi:hypothetical protein
MPLLEFGGFWWDMRTWLLTALSLGQFVMLSLLLWSRVHQDRHIHTELQLLRRIAQRDGREEITK